MTRLRLWHLALVLAAAGMAACDKIDYRDANEAPAPLPVDSSSNLDSTHSDSLSAGPLERRVLLLDFTGQKCGNCPVGHVQSASLAATYGSRFLVMGVHCGFFAEPSRTDTNFSFDFRTTAGNEIDTYYAASNAGLPRGVVNGKHTLLNVSAWASATASELNRPAKARMAMRYASGRLTVHAAFPMAADTAMRLTVYVLRDSMRSGQTDYNKTPNTQHNYYQRHVLRARPYQIDAFVEKGFAGSKEASYGITFDDASKPWRNQIIATLSNPATGEVYQVAEAAAGEN